MFSEKTFTKIHTQAAENKNIMEDVIEQVIAEDKGIIVALRERMEDGVDFKKIKKAFASNFKFKVENKLVGEEGLDENSSQESIAKFREKYPLKEIEKELYDRAEKYIKIR